MPFLPLHGHAALRARLNDAITHERLPSSLLLQGAAGIGKQRLALWIGQRLVCDGPDPRPCGSCQQCRYALAGTHPDIHWYFPRPRLKDGNASPAQVTDDFREVIAERAETGAYSPAPPADAILIATTRSMVQSAALAPAMAARKIYIVGDAERMVVREGAEEAAGAFLKLLEEPPARATIILTSSEPGALIPTIRSRVVAIRMAPLSRADTESVLREPAMAEAVAQAGAPGSVDEQLRVASGAPGALLQGAAWADAIQRARALLEATAGNRQEQARTALLQGSNKARGSFTTTLEALTALLHERIQGLVTRGAPRRASDAARAINAVEQAKERATANVNPQLITSELIRNLRELAQ